MIRKADHDAQRIERILIMSGLGTMGAVRHDAARLAAVWRTGLLDSPPLAAFDNLTRIAAHTLDVPLAFISLIAEDRDFVLSQAGTGAPFSVHREMTGETFCQHALEMGRPLFIGDTRSHPTYCTVPAVSSMNAAAYGGVPLRLASGEIVGTFSVIDECAREWTARDVQALMDIAGLAQTELELRSTAERGRREHASLDALLASALEGIYGLDAEGRCTFINRAGAELLGYSPVELIGRHMHSTVHHSPADEAPEALSACALHCCMESSDPVREQQDTLRHKDGSAIPVEYSCSALMEHGARVGAVVTFRDITQRLKSAAELHEGEQQYRLLFERNPNPMWVFSSTTLAFLAVNDAAVEKYGYSRDEFLSMTLRDLRPPEDLHILESQRFGERGDLLLPARHVTKHGVLLHVQVESHLLAFNGEAARLAVALDVTDRRRAEAAARAGVQRYRDLFQNVPVGLYQSTPEGQFMDANPALITMLGYPDRDSLLAASQTSLYADPSQRNEWRSSVARDGEVRDFEVQLRRRDGELIWVRHTSSAHTTSNGTVLYYEGAIQDITQQKKLEVEQAFRGAILEAQTEASLDGILVVDYAGRIVTCNERFAEMWKIPKEVMSLGIDRAALAFVDNAVLDVEAFRERIEYLYAHPSEESREEIALADGRIIDRYSAPIRAQHGSYYGRVWYFRDLTSQKQLEMQLLQTSKMEAVGKLAGGVAHDFNNILTAIQGQAQLLLEELGPQQPIRSDVQEIEANARRAADLTRQLLAFSRQQILQARVLDLREVVGGMETMLRRLIGSHVRIVCAASPNLWSVRADPSQIEQIVLNLSVNAEHAMPSGGLLTIRLENETLDRAYGDGFDFPVQPGDYVRLSVEDTGEGMDSATKARIFEPFFTTREQGQGTGLGLSTVYGVVKQSGGYIWVDSEPGRGTTFRVYLPAVSERAPAPPRPASTPELNGGRGETVIVCEDEDSVRSLITRVLEKKGYTVLGAATPDEAIRIAASHDAHISLLLTDIVLPGMGGRDLAHQIQLMLPGIRTILMSGYSEADLAWNDDLGVATPFLQKPFTPANLVRVVGEILSTP